ncbi:hypothetical protein RRG08_042790 [Elysia crispata]|uniref:Uncharacterized protein n=1 Tax=Elysia crispata TaxID=231223 RepID=A0AAE0XNW3_9GAST|nr:hypothetical protein RRG08_042790 [Elysia crispata]
MSRLILTKRSLTILLCLTDPSLRLFCLVSPTSQYFDLVTCVLETDIYLHCWRSWLRLYLITMIVSATLLMQNPEPYTLT